MARNRTLLSGAQTLVGVTSPGGLVKTQITGPCSQPLEFSRHGWGPELVLLTSTEVMLILSLGTTHRKPELQLKPVHMQRRREGNKVSL